ncbi:unnamed protein product [Colias eurytheme]|nr:unnamed protein product [Colias eurytheme]
MSPKFIIFFSVIVCVYSKSVIVGRTNDGVQKVYEMMYEVSGFPLVKRHQEITFEYPIGDQNIKGIAIKDLENGDAEASITSGGLGFNFVTIKLKSARGSGYKFLVEMYA